MEGIEKEKWSCLFGRWVECNWIWSENMGMDRVKRSGKIRRKIYKVSIRSGRKNVGVYSEGRR